MMRWAVTSSACTGARGASSWRCSAAVPAPLPRSATLGWPARQMAARLAMASMPVPARTTHDNQAEYVIITDVASTCSQLGARSTRS